MNAWKPVLAALTIFAAGVVVGGMTVHLSRPDRPARGGAFAQRALPPVRWDNQIRDLSRRLGQELDLTVGQRAQIEQIVLSSQERVRAVWDEMSPRTREEFQRMREQIRAVLTPEQKSQFAKLFRDREEIGVQRPYRNSGENRPPARGAESR